METQTASTATTEIMVRQAIAEALALEVDDVPVDGNLIEELGAESLDFLDIVFRIERSFDIEITRGEMERAARGDMSEEEFAPDGVISNAGLARLKELMPESSDKIEQGLRPTEILGLFTPKTFINMVEGKKAGTEI